MTVPAGIWGAYRLPVSYAFQGPGWQLQAADAVLMADGSVRDWAVVGPFPNDSGKAIDTAVHPPERRLDLAATYDSPRGPLQWKTVTSKDGSLNLRELLGDGRLATAYAVAVLRAAHAMPVQISVGAPEGISVYVNRQLVLQSTRVWRTQAALLNAGDNVILCVACSGNPDWRLSMQVQPLEAATPGDLAVVPAAELSAVPALHVAGGPVPAGPSLPLAGGQNWKLVYDNDFSWPRVGSEWATDRGLWSVQEEALHVTGDWPTLTLRQPVAASRR